MTDYSLVTYSWGHLLTEHENSHRGKKFRCKVCEKSFIHNSSLANHIKLIKKSCSMHYVKTKEPNFIFKEPNNLIEE